ncbi:MAG: aldo/keto reductase [Hyphomonas sp.]
MSAAGDLVLPDYGLGAAGLGNLYTAISDDEARDALEAASAAGLNYIDTAPYYGHGLSEQRIGDFLAASGARPYLSTKVGRRLEPAGDRPVPDNGFASPAPFIPEFDYSASGIREAFAGSQSRLGVDAVDILLLHDIGRMTHGKAHRSILAQAFAEALPEMAALKAEGKTRWIGLGVNEIDVCQSVLEKTDLDVLLIAGRYTLLEHEASTAFLDECHERGVKIIIGGAFNSGLLVASGDDPAHYDYADAPDWALERARMLRTTCQAFGADLPAAALQFCSAHPAVASVIPGARTKEQVHQIAAWAKAPIDPDLWIALKDLGLISPSAVVPS